jgi:hypothetical protein
MRLRGWLAVAAVSVVAAGGCATAGQGGSTGGSRTLITQEEIAALNVQTAYEAIRRLRPFWLRPGYVGGNAPVVYLDNIRQSDEQILHRLGAHEVVEVRYMNSSDATTRYGTGHDGGAILVFTRR